MPHHLAISRGRTDALKVLLDPVADKEAKDIVSQKMCQCIYIPIFFVCLGLHYFLECLII